MRALMIGVRGHGVVISHPAPKDDPHYGCYRNVTPDRARQYARALLEAADTAEKFSDEPTAEPTKGGEG